MKSAGSVGYWEGRYASGGESGSGSIGRIRDWKWKVIRAYVGHPDEVLDVGCGDLSFWEGRECASYLGIDIAPSVLAEDRGRRPTWAFVATSAAVPLRVRRRIVLCLDLLFHILSDSEYYSILDNLCMYTAEWLFIFTWQRNPFDRLLARIRIAAPRGESRARRVAFLLTHPVKVVEAVFSPSRDSDDFYQKFRPLNASFNRLRRAGLNLEGVHQCPHDGGLGALYVFRRMESGASSVANPHALGNVPCDKTNATPSQASQR